MMQKDAYNCLTDKKPILYIIAMKISCRLGYLTLLFAVLASGCSDRKSLEQEHKALTQYYQHVSNIAFKISSAVVGNTSKDPRDIQMPNLDSEIAQTTPQYIDIIKSKQGKIIRNDLFLYRQMWLDANTSIRLMIEAATDAISGKMSMGEYGKISNEVIPAFERTIKQSDELDKSIAQGLNDMRRQLEN